VQRVFIMDQAESFLPLYLRFIKGVVDSNDLSLNVSRDPAERPDHRFDEDRADQARAGHAGETGEERAEQYKGFWKNFGQVLKEGPAEDFANKEKIAGLLRFASTHDDSGEQSVALADYLARAKEGQDLLHRRVLRAGQEQPAPGSLPQERHRSAAAHRPHRRVADELPQRVRRQGFVDVARGDLDLGKLDSEEDKKAQEEVAKDKEGLVERLKARWVTALPKCAFRTA
jgi:molecular chaperone HtpG